MLSIQFESVFKQHAQALSSFAYKLTKNKMDADDLVQETAIKAYSNFEKFKPESNFKNWSFTILKNTFISKYRARKRKNIVSLPVEELEYAIKPDINFDKNVEETQTMKYLTYCLNSLSEKSKKPFKMYLKGYQYDEISVYLDIPLGTVKSRIYAARMKMKTMLKNKSN